MYESTDKKWHDLLFRSIREYDIEKINIALANINDINSVINIAGATPLMESVCKHQDDVVRMLLEKGANPNAKDNDGYSALIFSCMTENIFAVKLLEKYGADIHVVSNDGHDLLYHSFFSTPELLKSDRKAVKNIIRFLVEKNIDVNRIDPSFNWGVYQYIIYSNNMSEMIDIFYDKNKNLDHPDDKNFTPLELSITMNDNKTFKKLLDFGADPFKGNNVFKTALAISAHNSYFYDILKKKYPEIMAATELNIL